MSEQLPPNELAGLTQRLDALAQAVAELKDASTAKEKKEAREEVSDAETALKKYAESHGISLEDAEEAMNEVRRKNRQSEIREALKSFTDEDWKEIFPAEEQPEEEEETEAKSKPVEKPKTKPKEKPEGDLAPAGDHWSDRKLF